MSVEAGKSNRSGAEQPTEAMVEALRPFAEQAERFDDIPGVVTTHDNVELWQNGNYLCPITVGDLRRARSVLAALSVPGTRGAINVQDPKMILAGIRQFGLASDGSDLRDLEATIDALYAPSQAGDLGAVKAFWNVGVWGDESTPIGMANIFCDAHEATIAAGIPKDAAESIVEAHNEALSAISSTPVGEMVPGILEAARLIDIDASEAEANNVTLKPEYLRALARSMRSRVELGIYTAAPHGGR